MVIIYNENNQEVSACPKGILNCQNHQVNEEEGTVEQCTECKDGFRLDDT